MPEAAATPQTRIHPASFRDPAGFVFWRDGQLYRQINRCAAADYEQLMQSGLYSALVEKGMLLEHEQADVPWARSGSGDSEPYKIIRPKRLAFISYPYEWCFSQLQDAALLTLRIQRLAIEHGMSLKDASAFNIQFEGSKPVFIDTLSFESYAQGQPWVGYRQACQHFLAPLALMSHCDVRLSQLLRRYLDGIPLDMAARLLPKRTLLRPGLAMHIHLHARFQDRSVSSQQLAQKRARKMSRAAMLGLIDSIESSVRRLRWQPARTEWGDYYADTNYTDAAMQRKLELVADYLEAIRPATLWDLGANTGLFSRLASERGATTVSIDVDPLAVERNYLEARGRADGHLLPLWIDLTNPSAARGWAHAERASLTERGPADVVLALALIHHLAIGGNIPLERIADYFSMIGRRVVVEWVPRDDSQVQRLFVVRKDVFSDYTESAFQQAFSTFFELERQAPISGTLRSVYFFRRRDELA